MAKHNKYVVGLLALSISTSFLSNTAVIAEELKNETSIVGSTKLLGDKSLLDKKNYKLIYDGENDNEVYDKAHYGSQGECIVNGIQWSWSALKDGSVSVKPCNIDEIEGEVVVPKAINNYKVTDIGEGAFELCKNLRTVVMPDTIKSIGESAFSECKCLTEINIPESVENIGSFAFSSSGIRRIIIPNNVTEIKSETFWNCTDLSEVMLSNKLESIEEEAFSRCSNLKSIIITKNVRDIKEDAFSYSGLTDLIILDGLEKIKDCTFKGCVNLETITIPDSVTEIGEEAFIGCLSNIKTIYCNDESYAKKYFKLG